MSRTAGHRSRGAKGAIRTALALALVPALATEAVHGSPSIGADEDVYLERAARFAERHGLASDELTLESALDAGFARIDLGLFDVRVPAGALADEGWLDEIRASVTALVDVQLRWVEWLSAGEGTEARPSALKGHAKTLDKWIRSWKTRSFGDAEAVRGRDLLDATEAKDREREALAFLATYMRSGGPLGPRERPMQPARLVLLPERSDFVEFSALVGQLSSPDRAQLWVPNAALWTYFDFGDDRAIALEYAIPDGLRDYEQSISMTSKNARGLEQHVAQLAARTLLDRVYRGGLEPMVAGGLANNLVIALFGEVDTRTDGDSRARVKSARSVFIPGGNPSGGTLPAQNADSRWRAKKGEDHFVGALRLAQKAGAGSAEERWQKVCGFELLDDSQSTSHVVVAPFLGPDADAPPPEAFFGDHVEFLRAYRSAFLYWLQTEAGGRKASAASYGRLLALLAEGRELPAAFQESYGTALSAPGGPAFLEDSLEGRFLVWLSKKK